MIIFLLHKCHLQIIYVIYGFISFLIGIQSNTFSYILCVRTATFLSPSPTSLSQPAPFHLQYFPSSFHMLRDIMKGSLMLKERPKLQKSQRPQERFQDTEGNLQASGT